MATGKTMAMGRTRATDRSFVEQKITRRARPTTRRREELPRLVLMTGLVMLAVVPSSTLIWVLAVLMVLVGLAAPMPSPETSDLKRTGEGT